MSDLPVGFDALGVRARAGPLRASIGDVNLGPAFINGQVNKALNDLPTARLDLDRTLMAGQPVDYFGQVELSGRDGSAATFDGNVTSAHAQARMLHLDCQTHPSLADSKVGRFESFNCDAREVVHLMTRTGGLGEELINIAGLDGLPLEVIETLIPLQGIKVVEPLRLGPLSLLPPAEGLSLVSRFEPGLVRDDFELADCHAVFRQVSRRMLPVEFEAVRAVDVVLAWVATRARYGLAYLPNGEPQEFRRTTALSRPTRSEAVLSRGLDSGRTWLREMTLLPPEDAIELDSRGVQWNPPSPDVLTTAARLGLMALRRATLLDDVLQRIQALWEAIEFYVAGVRSSRRFDDSEARRVRKSVPKDIEPELRERVLNLLGKINDPPLMVKLREAAHQDGVPITEAELDLLSQVRKVRNDTSHGRSADVPAAEDVDYAVSVVARLLLHRIAACRAHRGSKALD